VVAFAIRGVRAARRGEIWLHRRCMLAAAWLVVGFVASYPLKLAWLGREALGQWSPAAIRVLRVHELCVAVLLVGGASALLRAAPLRDELRVSSAAGIGAAPGSPGLWPARTAHRRSGWIALIGACLGVLTAGLVLAGMYLRGSTG
jgi:uncharacterized membrane protein YozB (DUF420 family)